MNSSRLRAPRVVTVVILAALACLAPSSARGQFASLLDTTARYAGGSTGSNLFNGDSGVATATDLNVPSYVVFDSLGNLYISDTLNNCVRKVAPNGTVSTVAGLRVSGNPSDTCNTASNPAPTAVQGLLAPTGLAIDSSNTLYIADSQHNCVRSLASGVVDSFANPALTTVAGTCTFVNTSSVTPVPDGLAVDSSSNLYISIVDSLTANPVYQVVRHRATDPATTICAVAGELSPNAANTLCAGIAGTIALDRPAGLVFDKNGNLFIADSNNDCVREIVGMTTQQTVVGQCTNDHSGSASTALNNPYGLAFSSNASLFISETGSNPPQNNVVSYNSGTNSLSLVAGLPSGASGPYNVSQDGQSALLVPLNQPLGVTTDTGGNIYLADSQNNVVRRMATNLYFPNTNVGQTSPTQIVLFNINATVNLTLTAGPDFNIVSTSCSGPLTPAVATCQVVLSFSPTRPGFRYSALQLKDSISGQLISVELGGIGIGPLSLLVPGVASSRATGLHTAVAVSTDSAGDTYVLEQGNGSTTADVLFYPAGGGGPRIVVAQGAGLVQPTALAVDGAGNIFVFEQTTGNIIRFGADGSVDNTYASGLADVTSMAIDGFGDLFVAQAGSLHNVIEIYAGGTRSVIAGNGATPNANGVLAVNALFVDPTAVALGPNGTVSIADAGAHYVYTIDSAGIIDIVAGNGTTTTTNSSLAIDTGLVKPDGLAIDAAGDIYVSDEAANVVYAVFSTISSGIDILPVIGTGTAGYTGDGGPSIAATIDAPLAVALDGSSDLFVIDSGNNALREVSYPVTSTISFGNVLIGNTAGPILQYLANAGNANLAFALPFTTTDPHYAVLATATTCTLNAGIMGAGGVCDIGYTFTPTVAGPVPGQSNLPTNSYNTPQTVFFNNEYGYATANLLYTLLSETEVYGQPFTESLTLNIANPPDIDPTGAIAFTVGVKTLCTVSGPFSGTVVCNAPESGLGVGVYTVDFTYTSGNSNYNSANGTTPLSITPAPLTVTPNSFTRQYGQPNPTFTGTVTGEVNGDVFNVTYSTTATQFSPVGNYPISATLTPVGSASLSNYSVTYNVGTLTIVPAGTGGSGGLTVTVNNASRQYGQPNPTFTGSVTGAVNGDTFTITYSTTATQFSPVGTYPITATVSGPAAANYVITVVPGTLTIVPAGTGGGNGLLVTVNNATRPYGQPNPTFTGTVTGLLNGDNVTVTYSTTATLSSPAGTYPITATVSGPDAANYVITVVPGTLTITRATTSLVVTVNNASRPYGAANPAFTSTVSGALNGDTFTVTYSTTATPASPVGNYPITATVTGPNIGSYSVSVVPGTLSITPATVPLTVTVNNATRPYGTPNPTFTGTVGGLLNGDNVTVAYSTAATQFSPVGSYPITATVSGPAAANYTVTVNPGTLTVTPSTVPVVVTVNNTARVFGAPNPTFTSTIAGALNGDTFILAYATPATALSPVGNYPITATVSGPAAANYANVSIVPGTLAITPAATATVVTTSASPVNQGTSITFTATVTYGAGLPVPVATVNFYNGTTLLGSGTLNASGVATYTTSTLTAGTYTITATYQPTLNFATSSGTVLQVVNPGSFTLSATPPNQFIRGSGSVSYAVTVSSVQGFAGPVALACSGLPADATCSFANATLNLTSGGTANTTLTVVTNQSDARLNLPALHLPASRSPNGLAPIAMAAAFPFGLGAFLAGLSRRKRRLPRGNARLGRSPHFRLLLALLCVAGLASLAGCACLSSIYQVYTIPITGTTTVNGASTQAASVTLTVAQQ